MRLLASGVCLLGVLCSWIPAGAQRLSADPVGAALQVAVEELARYPSLCSDVPGASPLGVSDCSVLERATLGNPFRFYWPDSSFAGFETAEPASLLSHLGNKGVCFPVYADRRSLGTINVQFKADGATSVTNFGGEGLVDEYLRLADEAPVGPGQRVSVIQAGIGEYAVVEDGSTISWMIRLGATEGSPWQTPEAVAPAIKSAIAKRRQLPQEREGLRSQQSPGTARSDKLKVYLQREGFVELRLPLQELVQPPEHRRTPVRSGRPEHRLGIGHYVRLDDGGVVVPGGRA